MKLWVLVGVALAIALGFVKRCDPARDFSVYHQRKGVRE